MLKISPLSLHAVTVMDRLGQWFLKWLTADRRQSAELWSLVLKNEKNFNLFTKIYNFIQISISNLFKLKSLIKDRIN